MVQESKINLIRNINRYISSLKKNAKSLKKNQEEIFDMQNGIIEINSEAQGWNKSLNRYS